MNKIHITDGQDAAISLALNEQGKRNYNREKSYIICESGTTITRKYGGDWFVGTFHAHIWHRGDYRFETIFKIVNGYDGEKEWCEVKHWKERK